MSKERCMCGDPECLHCGQGPLTKEEIKKAVEETDSETLGTVKRFITSAFTMVENEEAFSEVDNLECAIDDLERAKKILVGRLNKLIEAQLEQGVIS